MLIDPIYWAFILASGLTMGALVYWTMYATPRHSSSPEKDVERLHDLLTSLDGTIKEYREWSEKMVRRVDGIEERFERSSPESMSDRIAERVRKSIEGERVRAEGLEFQEWSAQLFRNLGFEVENNVFSNSDHVLSLDGETVMIVSVKNWNLEKRNRTVNEGRLGAELEGARELEVPLLSHVHNKKLKRNWFHLFDVDELEDPKETSPDWLRNENLTESQEEEMKENYRRFHEAVDELLTR